MDKPEIDLAQQERRGGDRAPLLDEVAVHFHEGPLLGPGQNISEEGVFFIAEGSLKVQVRLGEGQELREGEVVRVQSMGEGKIGLAVKFHGP